MHLQQKYRTLIINPGSTSTKIGVFENEACLIEKTIRHSADDLNKYSTVMEQYGFRKSVILNELHKEGINISKFDAVCGRGGLLRPISGGTYRVNQQMIDDLETGYNGEHASNLGGLIAYEIANDLNIPAYIVDPVVVDELEDVARISGLPELPRKSIFHALNQKAVARRTAAQLGVPYDQANLIVAHMGGGITIGAHRAGKVVDVNNGLHGDGPFTPERAGTVSAGDLVGMCYSGRFTYQEIMKRLKGNGGLKAYLQTTDGFEIEQRISKGDKYAGLIYEAMAYQVAKEIGAMSVVLAGKVDAIAMTGGLANGRIFTELISSKVEWIADVFIFPGENELQALAEGTYRVLAGKESPKVYPDEGKGAYS